APSWVPGVAWTALAAAAGRLRAPPHAYTIAGLAALGGTLNLLILRWAESARWTEPIRRLARELAAFADDPSRPLDPTDSHELRGLIEALHALTKACQAGPGFELPSSFQLGPGSGEFCAQKTAEAKTRGGIRAALAPAGDGFDESLSGDFSTTDMVSRLDPRTFRWLESSPAEQDFLGWTLKQLREKSFLEIVHPDDYQRARQELK